MHSHVQIDVTNFACEKPHAIQVNDEPRHVSNDLFDGQICLIHRPIDSTKPFRYEKALAGTRRRCELQLQCRFKAPPQGRLWVGGEISGPLALSFVTRPILEIFLRVIKQIAGASLEYSTGLVEGKSSNAYLRFLAVEIFNVVVVTQPGETAPVLGSRELSQMENTPRASCVAAEELMASSKCSNYIFTFTMKNMYVDVFKWSVMNVPGLPPFGFETFWGARKTFRMLMYSSGTGSPRASSSANHLLNLMVTHRINAHEAEDTDDWAERALDATTFLKQLDDDCDTESFFSCEEEPYVEKADVVSCGTLMIRAATLFKFHPKFRPFGCLGAAASKICSGSLRL